MDGKIEITVKAHGNTLQLVVSNDLDIYEMAEQLKIILRYLTYSEKLINEVLIEDSV